MDELKAYFTEQLEIDDNLIGTYTDADGNTVVLVLADDDTSLAPHMLRAIGVKFVKAEPVKAWVDHTARYRPAPSGVSVGSYRITAGTIGAIVRDKRNGGTAILSNNHVLANVDSCQVGDDVLQPGDADGGVMPGDTIADLTRWVPLRVTTTKKVDCAIARVRNPDDVSLNVLELGYCYGTMDAYIDQKIHKSGRTTELTRGTIIAIDATMKIDYGVTTITLQDLIISEIFGGPGDSGSGLYDFGSNRLVGLLFAGNAQITVGCKASNIWAATTNDGGTMDIETIDPPEIMRSQWLDLSHWQGAINFAKVKSMGIRGVIIKVCQGVDIIDSKFAEYYEQARAAGLLVTGYIFVDPQYSASAHFDNFVRAVGSRSFDVPPAMDCEVDGGQTPAVITACYESLSSKLEAWYGGRPFVYSNLSFWNTKVLHGVYQWDKNPLWMAYWSDAAFYPDVPAMWKGADGKPLPGKPEIWQYDVCQNGAALGVGSQAVDCNLTFRSFEALLGEPPPPPDTVTLLIDIAGQGSVSPGSGEYELDSTIQLTATGAPGWAFNGWGGDLEGKDNPATLLLDDDKFVIAAFIESTGGPVEYVHNKGVTTVNLNYRTGPSTAYTRLGTIPINTTVEILDTARDSAGNTWARIGYNQWAAMVYTGLNYIEYVTE